MLASAKMLGWVMQLAVSECRSQIFIENSYVVLPSYIETPQSIPNVRSSATIFSPLWALSRGVYENDQRRIYVQIHLPKRSQPPENSSIQAWSTSGTPSTGLRSSNSTAVKCGEVRHWRLGSASLNPRNQENLHSLRQPCGDDRGTERRWCPLRWDPGVPYLDCVDL